MDIRILEKYTDELAEAIHYPCKKRQHLQFAMKLSCVKGHIFFHSGLQAVGRELIEAVHTHYLFTRGYNTEKEINKAKEIFARKHTILKFGKANKVYEYVYNNEEFYREAVNKDKFPVDQEEALVERIVGAMYYDSDWETTKDWIINNLGIRVMKKAGAIESSK